MIPATARLVAPAPQEQSRCRIAALLAPLVRQEKTARIPKTWPATPSPTPQTRNALPAPSLAPKVAPQAPRPTKPLATPSLRSAAATPTAVFPLIPTQFGLTALAAAASTISTIQRRARTARLALATATATRTLRSPASTSTAMSATARLQAHARPERRTATSPNLGRALEAGWPPGPAVL